MMQPHTAQSQVNVPMGSTEPADDSPFDSRAFRNALGLFPTGVAVVTTLAPDQRKVGLTVNSFTSVSLSPPLVSFNLAKSLRSISDWLDAEAFAVNLLRHNQQLISSDFARAQADKWANTEHTAGRTSSPILSSNLASFECVKFACHEVGDHYIMIGKVVRFVVAPDAEPLVFYRGTYCRVGQSREGKE